MSPCAENQIIYSVSWAVLGGKHVSAAAEGRIHKAQREREREWNNSRESDEWQREADLWPSVAPSTACLRKRGPAQRTGQSGRGVAGKGKGAAEVWHRASSRQQANTCIRHNTMNSFYPEFTSHPMIPLFIRNIFCNCQHPGIWYT